MRVVHARSEKPSTYLPWLTRPVHGAGPGGMPPIQRPSVCESSAGQMSRAVSTWRPGHCLAGNDRRGKPLGSAFPWAGLQATQGPPILGCPSDAAEYGAIDQVPQQRPQRGREAAQRRTEDARPSSGATRVSRTNQRHPAQSIPAARADPARHQPAGPGTPQERSHSR